MTKEERKNLATQLAGNRFFVELMERLEADAIEALVRATTEQDRVEAQWRVRSVRSFRSDCQAAIGSDRVRKAAPA